MVPAFRLKEEAIRSDLRSPRPRATWRHHRPGQEKEPHKVVEVDLIQASEADMTRYGLNPIRLRGWIAVCMDCWSMSSDRPVYSEIDEKSNSTNAVQQSSHMRGICTRAEVCGREDDLGNHPGPTKPRRQRLRAGIAFKNSLPRARD